MKKLLICFCLTFISLPCFSKGIFKVFNNQANGIYMYSDLETNQVSTEENAKKNRHKAKVYLYQALENAERFVLFSEDSDSLRAAFATFKTNLQHSEEFAIKAEVICIQSVKASFQLQNNYDVLDRELNQKTEICKKNYRFPFNSALEEKIEELESYFNNDHCSIKTSDSLTCDFAEIKEKLIKPIYNDAQIISREF